MKQFTAAENLIDLRNCADTNVGNDPADFSLDRSSWVVEKLGKDR